MPVTLQIGNDLRVSKGIMSEDDWTDVKREVAQGIHADIMRAGGPQTDEDPQVKWNYSKDWRTAKLPPELVFGSDYDYWNLVVAEAKRLWDAHAPSVPRDWIAERIARKESPGWSSEQAYEAVGLWENGVRKTFGTPLHGLRVDFGPTADFAAFLEQWPFSGSKESNMMALYKVVGLMNFISKELARVFQGVHTIYLMPIYHAGGAPSAEVTPGRKKPVNIVPVIRINSRHYRR